MQSRAMKYGLWILGALLIGLTGARMFHHLPLFKDLICWDEAFYMFRGMNFFQKIPREWAPAYGLWYWLQFVFNRDTISLYYQNFKILAIAGPLLTWFWLLRFKIHPAAAMTLAMFFLFSDIQVASWPYVSHFCVVVLIGGLLLTASLAGRYSRWTAYCALALLLSYARPEYYLAFLIFAGVLLIFLGRDRFRIVRREALLLGALLIYIALAHRLMGFPISGGGAVFGSGQYARSVFAFGNHFAIRLGEQEGIEHAWLIWESIFRDHFEVSNSLWATVSSNWPAFFKHVFANAFSYISHAFFMVSDLALTQQFIARNNYWNLLIWLGPILLIIGLGRGRSFFSTYYSRLQSDPVLPALLILTLPAMISCIFIYPRDHYLLLQAPLFLYLLGLLFKRSETDGAGPWAGALAIGIALLCLAPRPVHLKHHRAWNQRTQPENLQVVETIRAMDVQTNCKLLEDEGGLSLFIQNPRIVSVFPLNLDYPGSIVDYIQNNEVKLIFVSYILNTDPNLTDDAKWQELKSDPERFSFRRKNLEGTESYLLIHESI